VDGGVEDLVVGHPGLHQDPTPGAATADHPTGTGEERQRLLGGPVAGR
jgi:hypothetical protein